MGAARVLHFGSDDCNRLAVLQQAGYEASVCRSAPELVQRVEAGSLDAVLFPQVPAKRVRIHELRTRANIPFVLFGAPIDLGNPAPFDLIIEPITSPEVWLRRLSRTIEVFRRNRENSALVLSRSQTLLGDSKSLRRDSEEVRRESEAARQKLRETRRKFPFSDK